MGRDEPVDQHKSKVGVRKFHAVIGRLIVDADILPSLALSSLS